MSIPAASILPIGLGGQIYYAEGLEKLAANIEEARPTIMVVVPRLFEVLRARDHQGGREAGQAVQLSCSTARCDRLGAKDLSGGLALLRPADGPAPRHARSGPRSRKRFGGRIKAMVSGGAPLNPEIGMFFHVARADHSCRAMARPRRRR